MSAVSQIKKRSGRFVRRPESHGKGNHSYNARIHHYTNGIPHPSSKTREPKRLKTKRKYGHVHSKYSSVFSRYLKEPTYPSSVKANKYNKAHPTKNHQDRLVMRIFGNENNFKMIKSLMNNANEKPKKNTIKPEAAKPPVASEAYREYNSHQPSELNKTNSEKNVPKDKDFDVKLEKAMLDLTEHKNNFYKDKSEFEKQIEQTKKDKDARIRQTFYGQGPYPGSHNVLTGNSVPDATTINSSNYYQPIGYATNTRFRPSTQEGSGKRQPDDGLSDGNILSNIDCISNDELKERLVVAEMIMKKLYNRNKDLETAIGKAQTKIKEVKRNTTQNFFRNTVAENTENDPANGLSQIEKTPKNDFSIEPENDDDEESEIEIGCKEWDKYREKEKKLHQELDKKIKYIFELEQKHINEKYDFDSSTYNQFLQKRLNDTMEESKRHFENYVQVRNMYNDLLESRALKKRGKRIANDSDLLNLKKSLKKSIQIHKDEIKRLRASNTYGQIEQLVINQESKLKQLESELSRKSFLEEKKEKHTKRLFRQNEKLKDATQDLLKIMKNKFKNQELDTDISDKMEKVSQLVSNVGGEAATAIEE